MLNRTRVENFSTVFQPQTILVVGDVMLDEFIWGKVRRISPEAPVPVVEVTDRNVPTGRRRQRRGEHPRAWRHSRFRSASSGKDSAAERVLDLLSEHRIETSGSARDNRPTTLKTRIIAHNQQVVRADRESREAFTRRGKSALANAFLNMPFVGRAVIVSDYDKGVVNRNLLQQILPQARKAGVPVFLDPKVHHADYYRPITMITPNQREAELLTGISIDNERTRRSRPGAAAKV